MAQLNSASDFGSEGWGFESLHGHIKKETTLNGVVSYFLEKPNVVWDFEMKWRIGYLDLDFCTRIKKQEILRKKFPLLKVLLNTVLS